ncbi:hypothetical protein [Sphingomonas sp. Leaf357]|uniref:hypothetical protein n=1 Tax=Sphingomonas sp. Leaf357 TaxID=1736350 RepID=UPI0012E2BC1E|nr:hypothetical protein [Sphingomonas sp. Leaf357]
MAKIQSVQDVMPLKAGLRKTQGLSGDSNIYFSAASDISFSSAGHAQSILARGYCRAFEAGAKPPDQPVIPDLITDSGQWPKKRQFCVGKRMFPKP